MTSEEDSHADEVGLAAQRALGERIKELNLLHALARRLLRHGSEGLKPLLQDIAAWLPPAMQFPDLAVARVRIGPFEAVAGRFAEGRATLRSEWREVDGSVGVVEVQYLGDAHHPFLAEEQTLLDSVADLLRAATLGMREAAEHREAEEALRLQEAQLQSILETARIGTIEWELRGGYVLLSEVAREILAFPPGTRTVSDLDFRQRIHPDHRHTVRSLLDRDLSTTVPSEHEFPLLLPDGRSGRIVVRSRVTLDTHGAPLRRSGVIFEAHERR